MKRKRFTEEQIIAILNEHDSGISVADLAKQHGVVQQSIYRWKSKYGDIAASENKRMQELEAENTKLKKLLADAMLDNATLKENVRKKW